MRAEIESLLSDLGITYRWVNHPAVFTVAESSQVMEDKRPIKNLLLEDKSGRLFLVIMDGNQKLNIKELAAKLGSRKLQFAGADLLLKTLGVTPGAVSLFGLLHDGSKDVEVVVDETLLGGEELGFHPNDNTATIFIPADALLKILDRLDRQYSVLSLLQ